MLEKFMREECNAVFLFIAELTGSFVPGSGTVEDKTKCGQEDYVTNSLPELDLTEEEDRKDLNEVMWLERLYAELDGYFSIPERSSIGRFLAIDTEAYRAYSYKWAVPVECDASASMLQYEAILLGDKRLMEMTNVIGDTLQDPWKLKGMSRLMLKKAATPMLYGSNKSCNDLWDKAGIKYNSKDVERYTNEMANGPFGLANLFKEYIINNAKPKAEMSVTIGEETFTVSCNRFRNVGRETTAYTAWDSIKQRYNKVIHTDTMKVPDLEQFRTYFVTLLVHNLDSQVADTVIGKVMDKYGWGIPIHDAFLVSPAAAADTRKWYAQALESIYRNRDSILNNFFKSIGITDASQQQWETLKSKVVPFEGEFRCSEMALK
jgi:hypothetical protein